MKSITRKFNYCRAVWQRLPFFEQAFTCFMLYQLAVAIQMFNNGIGHLAIYPVAWFMLHVLGLMDRDRIKFMLVQYRIQMDHSRVMHSLLIDVIGELQKHDAAKSLEFLAMTSENNLKGEYLNSAHYHFFKGVEKDINKAEDNHKE